MSHTPQRRWRRAFAPAAAVALLSGTILVAQAPPASAEPVQVGAGSYTTTPPAGASGPGDLNGAPVSPKVTADFDKPVATNDWWSSLIFQRYPDNPYGENLYAHPLSFKARSDGLEIGHTATPQIVADGLKYEYPHSPDLTLGVQGLDAPSARVADYSDWTVTADLSDSSRTLRATVGQGLPFAYADVSGGPVRVEFSAAPTIWHQDGGVLGATVNGRHYALFAPSGTAWSGSGTVLTADVGAEGYASVAALPDPADLDTYAEHAYSFVTGSTLTYDYDPDAATLTSRYGVTTEAREGSSQGTLLALYPHQWKESDTPLTDLEYASPRGPMRVVEGDHFTTELTTQGVLPSLPTVDSADHQRLRALIDAELDADDPWKGATDTYWSGKALGRLAQLVPIADSIGYDAGRDELLGLLKGRMEDWLTADGDGDDAQFHYNSQWDTLIGYPASFGSDSELNDHDFHYGYFVTAAATIARYDRAWIGQDQWGAMVETVLKDANNPDRGDDRFPWMRSFSPYAGHGWASGHAGFAAGNNQESSSEAMHFAASTALLGSLTGDDELRDLGVYMHTTQASAMSRYWQNSDGDNFPDAFAHDVVGMVWGDGGDHRIWWDGSPEELYGINYLPITAGSLYLGHDTEHAAAMHDSLVSRLGRDPQVWREIHWAHQALSDPQGALSGFEAQWQAYEPESGSSKAHTYQWLSTLAEVGTVDTSVTADTPHYAVFTKDGTRTHAAFNAGTQPITVTFSDGAELTVQPGRLATEEGDSGPDPDPDPTDPDDPGDLGDGTLHLGDGTLSGTPGAAADLDIPSAGGANHDGTPANPAVFEIDDVTATHDTGQTTRFTLPVDSGSSVGNAVQARVSYDLQGDGTFDRIETYNYFATNDLPGWETYTQAQGTRSSTGQLGDLDNGTVRLELWSALGNQDSRIRTGGPDGDPAVLRIPFHD
ncbi:glycosyl hydrolase [Actinorugispora endophytica]|uniref:glucan endo-1,3-beta-D-glucosidase n=1 Tax=Actinorugispora endophytica TaxID=1605990 RepID=A0A4R6UXB8_9ACTN|nr:glycosyl hydrolase [Actinorugispora endophytica]TDQ48244.1 endoglucanase Acf2 [Actinorugispora endophytica]